MVGEEPTNGKSYLTCGCGRYFQVLNEDGTDTDAVATWEALMAHQPDCDYVPPAAEPETEDDHV